MEYFKTLSLKRKKSKKSKGKKENDTLRRIDSPIHSMLLDELSRQSPFEEPSKIVYLPKSQTLPRKVPDQRPRVLMGTSSLQRRKSKSQNFHVSEDESRSSTPILSEKRTFSLGHQSLKAQIKPRLYKININNSHEDVSEGSKIINNEIINVRTPSVTKKEIENTQKDLDLQRLTMENLENQKRFIQDIVHLQNLCISSSQLCISSDKTIIDLDKKVTDMTVNPVFMRMNKKMSWFQQKLLTSWNPTYRQLLQYDLKTPEGRQRAIRSIIERLGLKSQSFDVSEVKNK